MWQDQGCVWPVEFTRTGRTKRYMENSENRCDQRQACKSLKAYYITAYETSFLFRFLLMWIWFPRPARACCPVKPRQCICWYFTSLFESTKRSFWKLHVFHIAVCLCKQHRIAVSFGLQRADIYMTRFVNCNHALHLTCIICTSEYSYVQWKTSKHSPIHCQSSLLESHTVHFEIVLVHRNQ